MPPSRCHPLAFLMLLAPITACMAQATAASPRPQAASPQTPLDAPRISRVSGTVSAPLTKVDGFYYVDVGINGRPFRFTLETGASFIGISQRAARALGLTVDSMEMIPGSRAPVVHLDSLRLGAALFQGLTARVNPSWDATTFDGIVSLPLLRNVLTTIDLAGASLRLENGTLPPPNGRDIVPILGRDRAGRIDVPLMLGELSVPAVLDTRSMFWIIAPDSLESQLALVSAPVFVTGAMGPSLGQFRLRGARLNTSARFGPETFERPILMLRDRPGTVVGVPFMEQFVFTLDQRAQRVRITRTASTPIAMAVEAWEQSATSTRSQSPTARGMPSTAGAQSAAGQPTRVSAGGEPPSGTWTMGFGMTGTPGGASLAVARVFAGSSAEKAGLVAGDQIVEFNGTPAAEMNPALSRAAATGGKPVKIVVLRDGNRVELMIGPYRMP